MKYQVVKHNDTNYFMWVNSGIVCLFECNDEPINNETFRWFSCPTVIYKRIHVVYSCHGIVGTLTIIKQDDYYIVDDHLITKKSLIDLKAFVEHLNDSNECKIINIY